MSQFLLFSSLYNLNEFGCKKINESVLNYNLMNMAIDENFPNYVGQWWYYGDTDYLIGDYSNNTKKMCVNNSDLSIMELILQKCTCAIFWYGCDYQNLPKENTFYSFCKRIRSELEKNEFEFYMVYKPLNP